MDGSNIENNVLVSNGNKLPGTNYIEKCTNTGEITASYRTGGIVGSCDNTIVSECKNSGDITSNTESDEHGTGGIVGNLNDSSRVEDSFNTGKIIQTAGKFVGGIVGVLEGSSNVERSYNYNGTIEAKTNAAGGIVGAITNGSPTIKNSYNYLTKDYHIQVGGSNVGGIVGAIGGTSKVNIYNCYSIEDNIIGTNKGTIVGFTGVGVVAVTIQNCYYYSSNNLDIVGQLSTNVVQTSSTSKKTLEEFKYPLSNKSSVAYLLNYGEESDNSFSQNDKINDGYPMLKWQEEQ